MNCRLMKLMIWGGRWQNKSSRACQRLNIPSKDLVKIIKELGIDVKNHMSTMEDQQENG